MRVMNKLPRFGDIRKIPDILPEIWAREPINSELSARLARKHPLYDHPKYAATDYVLRTVTGKGAPPDKIAYILNEIRATCARFSRDEHEYEAYMNGIDAMWPRLEEKLKNSDGLAEYLLGPASNSTFLPLFYANCPNNPLSMEAPFGRALNLNGQFCQVPPTDAAYALCSNEPIFIDIVVRIAIIVHLGLALGHGRSILSLMSGMLPEMFHFGWGEYGVGPSVIACDNNPQIMPAFKTMLGVEDASGVLTQLQKMRVKYCLQDCRDVLNDSALRSQMDLVTMAGGMSYFPRGTVYEDQLKWLIPAIADTMRPGALFFFDVQPRSDFLVRCGVLGWADPAREMKLFTSVDEVVKTFEPHAKNANLEILDIKRAGQFPIVQASPNYLKNSSFMVLMRKN